MTQLRRKRLFPFAAFAALTIAFAATAATAPAPVKVGPRNEVGPAASDDWFVWSKSRAKQTSPFDLFAQQAGPQGLQGQPEEHAGLRRRDRRDDARLPADPGAPRRSDLRLYDLTTRRLQAMPRWNQHATVGVLRDDLRRLGCSSAAARRTAVTGRSCFSPT